MFTRSSVSKLLAVGSLNVRGIRENQTDLADDMQKYKLDRVNWAGFAHQLGSPTPWCTGCSQFVEIFVMDIFLGRQKGGILSKTRSVSEKNVLKTLL